VTFNIYTLGCKVNQYESELIKEALIKQGFLPSQNADIVIINTCTVTGEAERKCRQIIRRAISENSNAKVFVCGCYARSNESDILKIDGVNAICKSQNINEMSNTIFELLNIEKNDEIPNYIQNSSDGRTRAYIKIGDGCEGNCAYCIIPFVRGKVKSRPINEIIKEVDELKKNGYKEIVLTAIELSEYGKDNGLKNGDGLLQLLQKIDENFNDLRIRLGSIDPALMSVEFVEKIAKIKCLTPHFHLSLQSGCDKVLNLMRRKYNTQMVEKSIEHIRQVFQEPEFTADIIAGFPNENDEDFNITRQFIKKLNLLQIHAFAYSKRAGTDATKMSNQVPEKVKKERVNILISDSKIIRNEILTKIVQEGKTLYPLFEHGDGTYLGHTPNFVRVEVKSDIDLQGKILPIKPIGINEDNIIGKIFE